jgi:hypothetical protein
MRPGRYRWALGIAVFVLAVLAAIQIASALPLGYDFAAYWSAARHLAAGEPIYPAATDPLGQSGQFKYLPIVAVPFLPFGALPLDAATLVWLGVELAIAAAMGLALLRGLAPDARPWAAAAYALFLPLVLEVTLGNLNLASVALMLAAWHWRDRPLRAAVPLAVAVGLKFLPAAMLLFYLAGRRWRPVAYAALAGIAALVVTLPWLGSYLVDYVALSPRLGDTTWVREVIARDEPAFLADVLWSTAFLRGLSLAALAAVVVLGYRSRDADDPTHLHHVALAISPYLAPFAFVWTTFLVASLPLFVSTLAKTLALGGTARALRLGALAVCWTLMQLVQVHDLVPVAAHLLGLSGLVALGLSVTPGRSSPLSRAVRTASA